MKNKKKPCGIKHEIREEKKREQRIGLAVTVALLIITVSVSSFLINSMLNQPSTNQTTSNASQPKAAIVDHLSLSTPNQTFTETATNTLKQAGYTVDYYPGEKVTVEFYRSLPTHGYTLVILRVHSALSTVRGSENLALFTSEPYTRTKYVWEQWNEEVVNVRYFEGSSEYLGISPNFVKNRMNEKFHNTTIIMMGCYGLTFTKMAEAFVEKGAKAYISWNWTVSSSHTDQATIHMLNHLVVRKQKMKQAVIETMKEVGPDPTHKSLLTYYPLEVGDQTIEDITGNPTTKP